MKAYYHSEKQLFSIRHKIGYLFIILLLSYNRDIIFDRQSLNLINILLPLHHINEQIYHN